MERHLNKREFMVGDRLSVADIALYAYTHRAELADYDLGPYTSVCRWHHRIASQACVLPLDENPEAEA